MTEQPQLRETTPRDLPPVLAIYPLAFPDEDLCPLVSDLTSGAVDVLSLGAFDGDTPVGHALFSIEGGAALLGPVCVSPEHQQRGLGSALIREGVSRLGATGTRQVFVLGDPGYYARFGFEPERRVSTPCPIPPEWRDAWQSLTIAGREPLPAGPLTLPGPWMDPALWSP